MCLLPTWLIHIAFIAEYLSRKPQLITPLSLLLSPASLRLPLSLSYVESHLSHRESESGHIDNKQVFLHGTLKARDISTKVAKLVWSLDQQKG